MRRLASLAVLVLAGGGCHSGSESSSPATPPSPAPKAEPAPAPAPKEPGRLPFDIVKVYASQTTQTAPPWHGAGGDWTFFDAKTPGGATFVVGIPPHLAPSKALSHDKALLAVLDRASGAKFVGEFAQAFHTAVPPPGPEKQLSPIEADTTVVTENAMRDSKGDFGGVGGGWTATTWEISSGADNSDDIRFNYNLAAKQGEFADRDPDSDATLAQDFARSLRDGKD